MQKHESVSLEIEHLIIELSCCVNDLQAFRQRLTLDDARQAELNLNKLESLISFVRNHRNIVRLAAV